MLKIKNKKIAYFLIALAIVALGFFLRAYNINNLPPGVYPDEAANGEDALRAAETGNWQWFYPANNGREGLLMNLIALCFKFIGPNILALKLPAILFGTLTILGIYLLAKEIFAICLPEEKKERASLIAAFLTAVSFWAINFSRIAFRANILPFVLVFSFYFLWKGMRNKKIWPFIWAGLFFGLGMHTYIAFRIAPAILFVTLISFWINTSHFWKKYWKQIMLFIFTAFLIASPMFYTFYAHPEYFESRTDEVSVFSPALNHGHLIPTFLRSLGLSLIKYSFIGDMNWRHNFPPYPILNPLAGLSFLIGIVYLISKTFKATLLRFKKKTNNTEMTVYWFLLSWFFFMLAPEFMTAEGLPHALRAIGTLPAVMLICAIGFEYILFKSERFSVFKQKFVLSLAIFALIFIGIFDSLKYHVYWADKEKVGLSFNKNLTDISKYIQTLPVQKEKFVITSYNTLERLPIQIFNAKNNTTFFYPNELEKIKPENPNNSIIFFTENNQEAIDFIKNKFPGFELQKVTGTLGSVYYILK